MFQQLTQGRRWGSSLVSNVGLVALVSLMLTACGSGKGEKSSEKADAPTTEKPAETEEATDVVRLSAA